MDSSSDEEASGFKSDADDEDEDDDFDGDRGRRRSGLRMPLKKRFDVAEKDEDNDDHDGYASGLSFGSDLYKDDEDQERLAAMTELNREMIFHDRAETRDNYLMRKRAEARRKRETGGKPMEKDQAPTSSRPRSSHRDSSRSVKKNALNELVAKRQKAYDNTDVQRKRNDKGTSRKRESSPFSKRKVRESSFSLSVSESRGEDISSGDEVHRENEAPASADDDRDDDMVEKLTVEEITSITVPRSKLLKWFREPFFEDIIVRCFVKVGIHISKEGRRTYRLCQVKDVDARYPHKQYKFGSHMTHKYLNCVWGADSSAARWQMTFISNAPPTDKEFNEWTREMDRCDCRKISAAEINEKEEAIANLIPFVYSASLVKQMLQEKKTASSRLSNIAAEKDKLLNGDRSG